MDEFEEEYLFLFGEQCRFSKMRRPYCIILTIFTAVIGLPSGHFRMPLVYIFLMSPSLSNFTGLSLFTITATGSISATFISVSKSVNAKISIIMRIEPNLLFIRGLL